MEQEGRGIPSRGTIGANEWRERNRNEASPVSCWLPHWCLGAGFLPASLLH